MNEQGPWQRGCQATPTLFQDRTIVVVVVVVVAFTNWTLWWLPCTCNAYIDKILCSTEWEDCICDSFWSLLPTAWQPHPIFGRFFSTEGRCVLLCKELIMAKDSRNMTMQRWRKFQLTPSLPQPVKFPGRKRKNNNKKQQLRFPFCDNFNQLSVLCFLMEVLSHVNVKRKPKNALKALQFTLLLVVFKWNHGSKWVNVALVFSLESVCCDTVTQVCCDTAKAKAWSGQWCNRVMISRDQFGTMMWSGLFCQQERAAGLTGKTTTKTRRFGGFRRGLAKVGFAWGLLIQSMLEVFWISRCLRTSESVDAWWLLNQSMLEDFWISRCLRFPESVDAWGLLNQSMLEDFRISRRYDLDWGGLRCFLVPLSLP